MSNTGRLEHIGVTVADMERALDFLTILGFVTQSRFTPFDPGAVAGITRLDGAKVREIAYVARDAYHFELLEYEAPERAIGLRQPCDTGYFHFALHVDDLDAVQAQLGSCAPPHRVQRGPAKGQRATYVYGPDGLTVELIEKPGGD
ncbi:MULTISPECIES: VOC family protein [unclassified Novosphingobium]|uniref:VOC family protein n=1 Tax=unclassified Novosphingobium TaxID=2644732 RepID=UPI00061C63C4|nr:MULTISPECIES: VOC family protein [unclassified Novosphingobium]NLR41131.1 hypothetical protein [Novosphingobium sp. ERW19]GAO55795.1 hypothetical protein NMD1_02948 [Novosphingobium sp. MD-1]